MIRGILSVLAGCAAAVVLIFAVDSVNAAIWPAPKELMDAFNDPAAMKKINSDPAAKSAFLAKMPAASLAVVLAGGALASFFGGWLAVRIAASSSVRPGVNVGVILTLAGIANNLSFPHLVWFWIMSMLTYLPMAFVGAKLATRKAAQWDSGT